MKILFFIEIIVLIFNIHIILIKLFNAKIKIKSAIIAYLLLLPILILATVYTEKEISWIFIFSGSLFSYLSFLFTLKNIEKKKIIYVALLYLGITSTFVYSINLVLQSFTNDFLILDIIAIIIQVFLVAICYILSINKTLINSMQYIYMIPLNLKILLFISVLISFILTLSLSAYMLETPQTIALITTQLSTIAIVIIVGIMWPLVLVGLTLNANYKAKINNLNEQMQAQATHYINFIKNAKDIRQFKHDFNNLSAGLIIHLKKNDAEAALNFFMKSAKLIEQKSYFYRTGSMIADALLGEKQAIAQNNNTSITFDGYIPEGGIESVDLCIILGNLLDNALEACQFLEGENIISVIALAENGFLFLDIENPVAEEVQINNHLPVTSKSDKENHGIGLISVQNTLKKYYGELRLTCENKLFHVEVTLDLI